MLFYSPMPCSKAASGILARRDQNKHKAVCVYSTYRLFAKLTSAVAVCAAPERNQYNFYSPMPCSKAASGILARRDQNKHKAVCVYSTYRLFAKLTSAVAVCAAPERNQSIDFSPINKFVIVGNCWRKRWRALGELCIVGIISLVIPRDKGTAG